MKGGGTILELTDEQIKILECDKNIVVSANAGTGKTATLILKIEQELEKNDSYKFIGAITFTVKATKEIRSRLHKNTSKVNVNTNNGFIFEEMISPFFEDYYRCKKKIILSTDYQQKFDNFDEGIAMIFSNGTIGSYKNIKKNFIFELAIKVINGSVACQKYLKAKYKIIFIDEYQDSDEKMHELFMLLNKKIGIKLFIIGDMKQSIYMWKNANPFLLKSVIDDPDFKSFTLTNNFRSTKAIQKYSNLFMESTRNLIGNIDDGCCKIDIIFGEDSTSNFELLKETLDLDKKFALLRYKKDDAEDYSNKFIQSNINCTYIPLIPIKEISTSSSWIYNGLVSYLLVDKISEYDFIAEIPGKIEDNQKEFIYIKKLLIEIKKAYQELQKKRIFEGIKEFGDYYGYSIKSEHLDLFYESVTNELYIKAIKAQEKDNIAITFHSSKGLQFEQVIIFCEDYSLNDDISIYNHYVASTRAKKKLIIVCNTSKYNSKAYITNLNNIVSKNNIKVDDIFNIIKEG